MSGRRQRRIISHERKRKTRAATMKKKKKKNKKNVNAKKEPTPAPQDHYLPLIPTAARRSGIVRRQDMEAAAPIKEHDGIKENECHRCEKRTCDLCGVGRIHQNDAFCPYNYMDGGFSLRTCRERCQPGMHPLLLASSSGSGSHHQLRGVVRVTNVPLSLIPGSRELHELFRQFRPVDRCSITRVSLDDHVGFGWVPFESCEQAQEAIDKLNGHLVGDRKLRVDWVYPQTDYFQSPMDLCVPNFGSLEQPSTSNQFKS